MSRQSMVDAIHNVPMAPIYGIVITDFDGQPYEYEVSWDDIERDFEWALEMVKAAGIGSDDYILCTTPNHELPWTNPFIRAFREVGATYVPAEQHSWDARRFLAVLDRLPITVVFGLWPETLSTIAEQIPDLGALFSKPRIIWARPEAQRELTRAGVDCLPIAALGPAMGIGLPDEVGLQVNGAEWDIRSEEGELIISARPQRRSKLTNVRTGLRGDVSFADDRPIVRFS